MNTLSSESILGIPSLRSPLNICSLIYILGSSPLPTNLFNTELYCQHYEQLLEGTQKK